MVFKVCKFLVISPYEGLKDLFLEVNKEIRKEMDVYVGDLSEGLAIAKSLEHRNYDVIISRGATAQLLQKHFSIPVMEIQMTGYDILRTLTLLNGFSGKIGMMSYLNNIPGANTIGQLLNMDITFYPISEENEIEREIERASNEGVQIIIGDVITTMTAAKFGIQAILITSGKEAILETVKNAEQLVYYLQKEKNQFTSLQQTFEQIEEGVLLFDERHLCTFINHKARNDFHFIEESDSFTIEKLFEVVPKLKMIEQTTKASKEIEAKMNGEIFRWCFIPIDGGGQALVMKKQETASYQENGDERAYFHFSSLVAGSNEMKHLIHIAKKVSLSDLPIIIYGESGVGKNSLAQAIHNHSERHAKPYVFVNCEAYDEPQLERELFGSFGGLLQKGAMERAEGGTLFIEAIGSMPFNLQGKLLQRLTDQKNRIRLIVASSHPLGSLIESGQFREDLYHALNSFSLKVPSLKEREDDLEDFIRIFIAISNESSKKQISGLRQSVLEELKRFTWPGNIQQLKRVVEQMCLVSEGPFVEYKEVQPLLRKLKEEEQARDEALHQIAIANKTLQEIEEEAILAVLKQEDFNQSKAARRLGINRSTLWRKIKQRT